MISPASARWVKTHPARRSSALIVLALSVNQTIMQNASVVRPDVFGAEWLVKVSFTPVITNPFD